jgi:RNA 2',3'-cyclic 3'-phosphodiesterase
MEARRIFLAIDISDAARDTCAAHIEALRADFPNVRVGWERREKLHLTLKFLGSVNDRTLEVLKTRIEDVAQKYGSFDLSLQGTGVFPALSRPRILWIGADDRSGILNRIHADLEKACEAIGFEREAKRFHPHVTIGRVREPQSARKLAEYHVQTKIEPVGFKVAELVIYESKLQPAGSVYSAISTAFLKS